MKKKLRLSFATGAVKGWRGFVWMLKIILPISLLTALLDWSGLINRLDFIFEPVMESLGLPAMAALPLVVGLLTGIYGGIAAMIPLPLTVDQMTLLAIFLLISHNLIQEGVVQRQSGCSFLKATTVRLAASIATVFIIAQFMDHATTENLAVKAKLSLHTPFLSMIGTWATATLILLLKMLVIIMALMVIFEIMKDFNLIDRIVRVMTPLLKVLGLGKQSGFLWLTAALFGLAYGAAVIVEETKKEGFTEAELERLHLSIGINHAMVEDTAVFMSLGLGFFWLCLPRFAAAVLMVHGFMLYRRLKSYPGFSKFSFWQHR